MRSLVAVVLAACSSAPTPPPSHRAPGTSTPTGPAPQIAWQDEQHQNVESSFALTRLPSVARSGEIVVIPLSDNDGGRGHINLRLEVRDHRDRLADTITIMTANEYEAFVPDGAHAIAELHNRITTANRTLAALHERHDLVAMHEFSVGDTVGRSTPVTGDALVVTFDDDDKLRVRTREGVPLVTVDGSSWLPKPGPRCAQCPPCENYATLDGFFKAERINVIVVRISFTGTDLCWEPSDQLHVVAW